MNEIGQRNDSNTKDKWRRIFLFTVIFIVSYFILITSIAPKKYDFSEGDIANVDIKATRDIIDEEARKETEKEIREKVVKQYSLKSEVKIDADKSAAQFFKRLINLKSSDISEEEKIAQLKKIEGISLTDSQYKTLINNTIEKNIELQWVIADTLEKVYANNIKEDSEENITNAMAIKDAREIATNIISQYGLDTNLQAIVEDISYALIKPNYFYDKEKTDELIIETIKNTPLVMIKKNQIIVKEGEPITSKQIETLTELGLVGNGLEKSHLPIYLALGIYVFLILLLQYVYLKKERQHILQDISQLMLLAILSVLNLLFARGIVFISPFFIPLGCTAILMTILLDYKLSVIINILNMMLVAVIVGFNPQIIILSIISIIIGATSIKKVNGRNDVLYSTIFLVVGVVIVTFTSGILLSNNSQLIISNMAFAVFGALFSGILAIGILPFLESGFKIVTNIKLLELSNPNNELLKRVLMEAPGTYHHSLMVANLAELAAEAVDANPIIARVGAYYHDIGKLKRPIFFGENQMGKDNPHNHIDPKLSTHIILSHARDGLELAKEYKLPKVIQDIIIQHHGTTLVKYFYYTVKNAAENPDDIKEEEFRYDGPIPSSKEASIVMLADSVEAAVRSINEPSKEKIEEMVTSIIKDKLYSNQLDDSNLTLKDIETIRQCFLNMLNGIYHQRVEYPKEKNEKE